MTALVVLALFVGSFAVTVLAAMGGTLLGTRIALWWRGRSHPHRPGNPVAPKRPASPPSPCVASEAIAVIRLLESIPGLHGEVEEPPFPRRSER